MSKIVKCPSCKKDVKWLSTSKFRPFCSERCRLIDLGDWASDKNIINDVTNSSGLSQKK